MRFAEFDVDPAAGVLSRHGERVKLQDLPFRVLVVLLGRAGSVVTRDELRAELWGAETFVDAEAGLNTAIAKLREALGDAAGAPRFIETLPKRGYRFIGTLAEPSSAPAPTPEAAAVTSAPGAGARRVPSRRTITIAVMLLLCALAGVLVYQSFARVTIAVVRFHNETGDAAHDRLAGSLTDAVVVSLAANRRYGVIGNSPVLRTERIFEDVRTIGAALDADYVVLGQLQQGDTGLVVRGHFIRVKDQKHVWAGKIDLAGVREPERAVTTAMIDGVAAGLARR
jgi:DNA-binding winged helix-turn-helix (wHTH) protein/TolB-like protein